MAAWILHLVSEACPLGFAHELNGTIHRFIPKAPSFKGVSRLLNELPFSREIWESIIERFPVRRSLSMQIRRAITSSSCTLHSANAGTDVFWTHTTVVKTLEGPIWPPSFAVSACHSKENDLTLGIVLGLDYKWMTRAHRILETILDDGHDMTNSHHLLMPRLSAELQIARLAHVSSLIRTRTVQWDASLRDYLLRKEYPRTHFVQKVLNDITVCGFLQNESRATKRLLKLAHRHAESFLPEWEKETAITRSTHDETSDRFLRRYEEMQLETKKLTDDSQLSVKGLSDQLDRVSCRPD